jgi:hypothetical protein
MERDDICCSGPTAQIHGCFVEVRLRDRNCLLTWSVKSQEKDVFITPFSIADDNTFAWIPDTTCGVSWPLAVLMLSVTPGKNSAAGKRRNHEGDVRKGRLTAVLT